MPPITVKREDWFDVVEQVRLRTGDPNRVIWAVFVHDYPACIPSLITDFSTYTFNLYEQIGGFRNETFSSFWDIPAITVDAFEVIADETRRINNARAKKGSG